MIEALRCTIRVNGLYSFAILGLFVCLFNPEVVISKTHAEDAGVTPPAEDPTTVLPQVETPPAEPPQNEEQETPPETVAETPENKPEEIKTPEEGIKTEEPEQKTPEEIKAPEQDNAAKEAIDTQQEIKTDEKVKKTDEEAKEKEKDQSTKEDDETKKEKEAAARIEEIRKFEEKKSEDVEEKKKDKTKKSDNFYPGNLTYRTGKLACVNSKECQKSPLDVYPFIILRNDKNDLETYAFIDPKSDPQKQVNNFKNLVKKSGFKIKKERKDAGLEGQKLKIKGELKKGQILFIPVRFASDGKETELPPEKISLITMTDIMSQKKLIDELTKIRQLGLNKKLTPEEEKEFNELKRTMDPYFKKIENKVSGRNREELIASLKEVVDGIIRKDLSDKNLGSSSTTAKLKLPESPKRPNKEDIREEIYDTNRAKLNELKRKTGTSYNSEYSYFKGELDEETTREYKKQDNVYEKKKKEYDEKVRGKQDTVSQIKEVLETFVSQFKIASERDIYYPQLLIFKELSEAGKNAFYSKRIKDLFAKDIFADTQVAQSKDKKGKKDRTNQKIAIAGAAGIILPFLFSGKPQATPPQATRPYDQQPYGKQPYPYPNPSPNPNPSPRPSYSSPGSNSTYGGSSGYQGYSSQQDSGKDTYDPYADYGSGSSSRSKTNSGYQWESYATEGMDALIVPIRYDDYSSDDPYGSYGSKSYSSDYGSYSSQSSSSYSSSYDPYASAKKVTTDKKQIPLDELLFDKDQMLRYAISQLDRNHTSCNSRSNCLKDDKKKLEDILNKINRKNKAWPILREIRDKLDGIDSDSDTYMGIDEAIREFKETQYTKIPSSIQNKDAKAWDTIMTKRRKTQDDLKKDKKTIEADKVIILNMAQVKNKYKILTPAEQKTKDKVDKASKVAGAVGAMQQGGSGGLLGYLEGLFGQKKGSDGQKKYKQDDSSSQDTMSDIFNMLGK